MKTLNLFQWCGSWCVYFTIQFFHNIVFFKKHNFYSTKRFNVKFFRIFSLKMKILYQNICTKTVVFNCFPSVIILLFIKISREFVNMLRTNKNSSKFWEAQVQRYCVFSSILKLNIFFVLKIFSCKYMLKILVNFWEFMDIKFKRISNLSTKK